MPLTPTERSLRARFAAYEKHAKHDPVESTALARAKSPGALEYWFDKVDPGRELPELERARRAEAAKRAHFTRLSFLASKARRKAA